jgi:hypothetical protein
VHVQGVDFFHGPEPDFERLVALRELSCQDPAGEAYREFLTYFPVRVSKNVIRVRVDPYNAVGCYC